MGAYTTLDSSPSFSEIRSAFNKSGQTSLNTFHTTFRYPRGSSSNISLNTFYRSLAYWHISIGLPHNSTENSNGFNSITAVTVNIGGDIKTFNSGASTWNSSEETYVMAASTYSTFTLTATLNYGVSFTAWEINTGGGGGYASTSNPATITASSYVNIRPLCYGVEV